MSDLSADSDLDLPDAPPPSHHPTNTQSVPDITDASYPNRPHNAHPTLPFHTLHSDLFEPLLANKLRPGASSTTSTRGARFGKGRAKALKPNEARRRVIERYVARWRREVGDDVFPVFRLIMPDKDRSRTVYNLKEKTIAQLLIKTLKITKHSDDAVALLNWKLPSTTFRGAGGGAASGGGGGGVGGTAGALGAAGDFAGRCYAVIKKRPMRTAFGDMTVEQVNELLDRLSECSKEEQQLPIFNEFYMNMNAEELMWVVRIILKQMKVGATEKTFFQAWHPDAENLFNVSSSLKRVCWELWDPTLRLNPSDKGVTLMSCFQPQLAQFQKKSLEETVKAMRRGIGLLSPTTATGTDTATASPLQPPPENTQLASTTGEPLPEFWIEEKLDGERMQMHMREGEFSFWSRKAKDYTYLYGSGFADGGGDGSDGDGEGGEEAGGSLTRYLKDAFKPGVRNIILDGEMITWDPTLDCMLPFGTLKTACLGQMKSPYDTNCPRPLFRVFDILYLNDKCLINYTLTDRRRALAGAINPVRRRLEIHEYQTATTSQEIEDALRKVVAEASEGLVVKNPRSMYCLNERNDDWMKVKPDYMTEYGEEMDLLVIGGYYGSGHRGGFLSSFLCGLRVDGGYLGNETAREVGGKWWSFCKVGGGLTAADFRKIQQMTEGKWTKYEAKKPPPKEIFELAVGGAGQQYEKPDEWIRPEDSFVVAVKAASVAPSDQFRMGKTLRFPRFKGFKEDKDWRSAMSVTEFVGQQAQKAKDLEEGGKAATAGGEAPGMNVETRQRKAGAATGARKKREINVLGQEPSASATPDTQLLATPYGAPLTTLFSGKAFFVASDPTPVHDNVKTKLELEQLIKLHGGRIQQSPTNTPGFSPTIVLADKKTVKIAALIRQGECDVLRTRWVFDSIKLGCLVPFEVERHLLHISNERTRRVAEGNVDSWGDSYGRDFVIGEDGEKELRGILDGMDVSKILAKRGEDGEEEDLAVKVGEMVMDEIEDGLTGGSEGVVGWTLAQCVVYILPLPEELVEEEPYSPDVVAYRTLPFLVEMLGAKVVKGGLDGVEGGKVTHVVVPKRAEAEEVRRVREKLAGRVVGGRIPRVVEGWWVQECVKEGTWVDEEKWAVGR